MNNILIHNHLRQKASYFDNIIFEVIPFVVLWLEPEPEMELARGGECSCIHAETPESRRRRHSTSINGYFNFAISLQVKQIPQKPENFDWELRLLNSTWTRYSLTLCKLWDDVGEQFSI